VQPGAVPPGSKGAQEHSIVMDDAQSGMHRLFQSRVLRFSLPLFLVWIVSPSAVAQSARHLHDQFRAVLAPFHTEEVSSDYGKCGTSALVEVKDRWQDLNLAQQSAIGAALQRPLMHTSRLSASGRFRIHYDTTGVDQPAMLDSGGIRIPNSYDEFIDSVAASLDYSWVTEVQALGYDPPPPDNGQGGGDEYDVYVIAQPSGVFGGTYWESTDIISLGPPQRYSTYVVIDNDFAGYRTPGLNGLMVTCAHELYHAIQIGSYGLWPTVPGSDFYFYELTSVWIEDQVYDAIDDYLFDVPAYLRGFRSSNRAYSFTLWGTAGYYGYERSVFAHYLAKRFGGDMIRNVWEGIRANPFLQSVDVALREQGSSFSDAFSEFSAWNFFTGDRSDTTRYYPDGPAYPRIDPHLTVQYSGYEASVSSDAYPVSTQYYAFTLSGDTILAVLTNVARRVAYDDPLPRFPLSLTAGSTPGGGGVQRLSAGLTMSLVVSDPDDWRTVYLSAKGGINAGVEYQPSPNPLSISSAVGLRLPLSAPVGGTAEVTFLSASLNRTYVHHGAVFEEFGRYYVEVPSSALRGKVSSGIYFVVLRAGDEEHTWKVAVVQ